MSNIKTVPNQEIVKVNKEKCDKTNLYAAINLEAMNAAAVKLKAGAFKLWCYFAKNQNGYEFALSSKDAEKSYGIKIDQYKTAKAELKKQGYLVQTSGNNYIFYEIPVSGKTTNEENSVSGKTTKDVSGKTTNTLVEKPPRNNTNTTNNNTEEVFSADAEKPSVDKPEAEENKGTFDNPILVSKEWLIERHNNLQECLNNTYKYTDGRFYKLSDQR